MVSYKVGALEVAPVGPKKGSTYSHAPLEVVGENSRARRCVSAKADSADHEPYAPLAHRLVEICLCMILKILERNGDIVFGIFSAIGAVGEDFNFVSCFVEDVIVPPRVLLDFFGIEEGLVIRRFDEFAEV